MAADAEAAHATLREEITTKVNQLDVHTQDRITACVDQVRVVFGFLRRVGRYCRESRARRNESDAEAFHVLHAGVTTQPQVLVANSCADG